MLLMADVWTPAILGHRGAAGLAPENTLAGFAVAAELDLPAAELDVHLTSDGHVVVIHDHTVDRTTDGTGRVDELSLAEIRELSAAVLWDGQFERMSVPTFDEVMARFGVRFQWEIELKVDERSDVPELVRRSTEIIERHGARKNAVLTSFSADALDVARREAPDLRRAHITGSDPLAALERAAALDCVQLGVRLTVLTPEVADAVRATGMALTGWQGNSAEELERLRDARVDAFSSDRPDIALDWLAGNGIEPARYSDNSPSST